MDYPAKKNEPPFTTLKNNFDLNKEKKPAAAMAGVEEETRIGNWENGAVVVVRLLEEEQLWRPQYQARISKPYAGGGLRGR